MDIEVCLRNVALGERGAFTQIYQFLQPTMARYAMGLLAGDFASAEDVVNEAFVAVWQQAGRYSGIGSATGWIRRIVRNKAIDWLRKQREVGLSDPDRDAIFNQLPDIALTPSDHAEANSEAHGLRAALVHLSVEHREAVWLCYFEDKSIAEIALIANCPENTVKTRLFHARKILATHLGHM